MKRNQLFKLEPSIDFVKEFVKIFGLKDINDTRKFSRDSLVNINTLDKFDLYKEELKKYYIPCKYDKYVTNLNEKKIVTILRQIVKLHDYKVTSQEKYIDGKKTLLYSLESDTQIDDHINYNLKVIEF
jgi:hypothetical protein